MAATECHDNRGADGELDLNQIQLAGVAGVQLSGA